MDRLKLDRPKLDRPKLDRSPTVEPSYRGACHTAERPMLEPSNAGAVQCWTSSFVRLLTRPSLTPSLVSVEKRRLVDVLRGM